MTISILFITLALIALIWQISLLISAFSGAPTVYAKEKIIKKAFEMAYLKSGQVVIDLGCGNARSLIIAAKEFGAKGIGIEISPFYFILAKLNVALHHQTKNIKIYYGNILKYENLINKADLIYVYLLEKLLAKIEPIIFKNLKRNASVVSLTFNFTGRKPLKKNTSPKIYIYK